MTEAPKFVWTKASRHRWRLTMADNWVADVFVNRAGLWAALGRIGNLGDFSTLLGAQRAVEQAAEDKEK